jgi:hypothetical protein
MERGTAMEQVRVAIVGLGIGRPMGLGFAQNTRGSVVAFCDLNEERMRLVADELPGAVIHPSTRWWLLHPINCTRRWQSRRCAKANMCW